MWAVSDDPVAVQLRKTTQIHFIPIMDVDSVAEGFGGKDAIPRDHNRDWDKKPVYPEVSAAQKMIQQLNDAGRFDIFIDLHNPGSRDRKPFFFGPKLESLQGKRRRNQAHWIGLASSLIEGCPKTYRFTSYIRTQEERDRVSRGWVHNHVAPHVMAATLETAWNRPEGSQEGYQKVGQQFGAYHRQIPEHKPPPGMRPGTDYEPESRAERVKSCSQTRSSFSYSEESPPFTSCR